MRLIAGALLVLCWLAVPVPAYAYKWFYTDNNDAVHQWEFKVPYYIDAGDLDFIEPPREDEIIQEAFAVWNALEAPLEFVFAGHVDPAEKAYNGGLEVDQNHIVFVKQSWVTHVPFQHENAIAVTSLTFDQGTGELLDADMLLNNDLYSFADCEDAPEEWLDYQDLFYVVLHEIGHMTGLGHSGDDLSVMFVQKSICAEEPLHHLTPDDIEGFLSFYGTDEYIDLATPPEPALEFVEPGLEFVGEIEGIGEVLYVSDGAVGSDAGDGGPRSADCYCRLSSRPVVPWGPLLLLFVLFVAFVRRRIR